MAVANDKAEEHTAEPTDGCTGNGGPTETEADTKKEPPKPVIDVRRASPAELQAAAKADGYNSVEEWKQKELELNARSDILKDKDGNLYSVPRQGTGVPQPLGVKLP